MSINRRDVFKLFAGAAFAATTTGLVGAVLEETPIEVGFLTINAAQLRSDLVGWPYEKYAEAHVLDKMYFFAMIYDENPDEDQAKLNQFTEMALVAFKRCKARIVESHLHVPTIGRIARARL